MTSAELSELIAAIGEDAVSVDSETLTVYGVDWTRYFEPRPGAVVFPRSVEHVESVVGWARRFGVPLVPSGGRTGLSAAAVASAGEVVVSFDRMNRIGTIDVPARTIEVEPGVVTEALQQHVAEHGFYFPVDFASRGSSQIGGNIATNAGGIKVLRYGLMRDWVAGLEVVTGSGQRMELNRGLVKNATGYDLRQLFVGSEGTLGFITRATLKVAETPGPLSVALLALSDLNAIMPVFHAFRAQCDLTAFEFFSDRCRALVESKGQVASPFDTRAAYYGLVEIEHRGSETMDRVERVFESLLEAGHVVDGVISQSQAQAAELWRLREDISEAATPFTPYKNDVSVAVGQVPEFVQELSNVLSEQYPDFDVLWFGHIGDGNVHINVLKPADLSREAFYERCQQVDALVFEAVARFHGSVSAEHGVGLIKKPFLHHSRSEAEIQAMRAIKQVFDPDRILNPGKIFD